MCLFCRAQGHVAVTGTGSAQPGGVLTHARVLTHACVGSLPFPGTQKRLIRARAGQLGRPEAGQPL